MSVLDATYSVLLEASEPLHYREINSRVLESGRWSPTGKTPEATVNSALAARGRSPCRTESGQAPAQQGATREYIGPYSTEEQRCWAGCMAARMQRDFCHGLLGTDLRTLGSASRFRKVRRGIYALAESSLVATLDAKPREAAATPAASVPGTMTLLDAAERVLRESPSRKPLSYIEITDRALTAGLIQTEGKTPAASLNAQVGVDIRRRQDRGELPRFVRPGRGLIALAAELPTGLAASIDNQNREVRNDLLKGIHAGGWEDFELLVEDLLKTIGLIDVQRTPPRQDRGVDVRGTVVVAGVMHIRIAVQTKCQAANVQAPRIRELRGSLRPHERGLFITTSDFSPRARKEAARSDVAPVALMNGEELAVLLAANADDMTADIGVRREDLTLFTLEN